MAWFYCVTNFANPSVVATSLWPYPFTALTTAILALINQVFQSWRIYMFTRSKLLIGFLLAGALAACGTGVAAAVQSWIFSELAKLAALQPVVEGNLALQSTIDVLISSVCPLPLEVTLTSFPLVILSYTFSKSKTAFTRTNTVLNRLIRGAVQSGVFTSVFALGTLLSFRFSPSTYMIALFALPIGRIYTHTMMDHLISREELRHILSNGNNIISVPGFNTGTHTGPVETIVMVNQSTHTSQTSKNAEAFTAA
ncbi:hypothetical protein B0H10DRAFT_1916209 [Mycena sp. CBHHK59/15]|nr:hypothetical protein B0H10DRAFT_1916209 [Mycena sp. CBHHK59/15]